MNAICRSLQLVCCLLAIVALSESRDCTRKSTKHNHDDNEDVDEVQTVRFLTPTAGGGNSAVLTQWLNQQQQFLDSFTPRPAGTLTATGTGAGNTISITTGGTGSGSTSGSTSSLAGNSPVPGFIVSQIAQSVGSSGNRNTNRRRRRRPNNNRRRKPAANVRPVIIGRGRTSELVDFDY